MNNQVVIEIYNPNTDEIQCRRLSRKLALLCYFLNTRLNNSPVQFVHGGVFGKQFNNSYKPGQNQTIFEIVVNKQFVINDAFYFDDENYAEEEFRGLSQHFILALSNLSKDFSGFVNYNFMDYAPIVVGNYYLREGRVDGRLTNNQNFSGSLHRFNNMSGSQYQTNGSVTVNRQTTQSYQNVSGSSTGNVISGSVSATGNLAGRKTVINVSSNNNNDSLNFSKRMSI